MVLRDLCAQIHFNSLCCCFGEDIGHVDLPVFLTFSVVFRVISSDKAGAPPYSVQKRGGVENHIPEDRYT